MQKEICFLNAQDEILIVDFHILDLIIITIRSVCTNYYYNEHHFIPHIIL